MKKFFTLGFAAILPLALTGAVLYLVLGFLYNNVGVPIGEALKWVTTRFLGWSPVDGGVPVLAGQPPQASVHAWFFNWGAPFIGFAVGIVLTLILGFFIATFFGKKLFQWFEIVLKKLPVVRTVYPYAKQFSDFFFSSDKKMDFQTAVAVPFPTPASYSIGFVTGEGMKSLNESLKKHLICVFVPAAPTPFSGFVIYVPREDVIPLPLTVEEAMRIIISAGVLHPGHQAVGPASIPAGPAQHRPMPEDLAKALAERGKHPS
jgi:uncharacterized membrane protein